jgi:hypothetical protein
MASEARLGLFAGIVVMLIVAVFFGPKSLVGTAAIGGNEPVATGQPPARPPAGTAFPDPGTHSIWQPQPPREVKPISRDPLLWP